MKKYKMTFTDRCFDFIGSVGSIEIIIASIVSLFALFIFVPYGEYIFTIVVAYLLYNVYINKKI